MIACEGSGKTWGSGTGAAICRVCHRGPATLGVKPPVRRKGKWIGFVPIHEGRKK